MKKQNVFMALALLLFPSGIQASHFLGGEIRYAPDLTNNNTYIIVITHYSNLNSPSDRPELLIDFGDGIFETIPRTGIQDILVAGTCGPVRISTYQTAHIYAGPGNYMIRFEDTNRNGGIVNVPNSFFPLNDAGGSPAYYDEAYDPALTNRSDGFATVICTDPLTEVLDLFDTGSPFAVTAVTNGQLLLTGLVTGLQTIRVFDALGKLVVQEQVNTIEGTSVTIAHRILAEGVYTCTASSAKGQRAVSVIINR